MVYGQKSNSHFSYRKATKIPHQDNLSPIKSHKREAKRKETQAPCDQVEEISLAKGKICLGGAMNLELKEKVYCRNIRPPLCGRENPRPM